MTRYVPSVTVITQADCESVAQMARRMTLDPTDHYPRSFAHWPCDPDVFAPPIAIDCTELERHRES